MENPCRYCVAPKRHYACHDDCPERKEWLFERSVAENARRSEERIVGAIINRVVETKTKMHKDGLKWSGKEWK